MAAKNRKTADAVAERDLIGGLLLPLDLHELLDGDGLLGQVGVRATSRATPSPGFALGAGGRIRPRTRCPSPGRTRHLRHDEDQALGVLFHGLDHLIGPGIGFVSMQTGGGHARGDAPQVLDQRQAKHDRNGPQLSERERRDGLVGRHDGGQTFAH